MFIPDWSCCCGRGGTDLLHTEYPSNHPKVNVMFPSIHQNTCPAFPAERDGAATRTRPKYSAATFPSESMMASSSDPTLDRRDDTAPGAPGAAEDVCDQCRGAGKLADGAPCPACGGSARVTRGIGGG